MEAAGLVLDGLPIMNGKLRRVAVDGDQKDKRRGAYVGYLDPPPAGFLENFRTGIRQNWKSQMQREALSLAEYAKLLAQAAESRRQRETKRLAIAAKTARLVEAHLAGMPLIAAGHHPYLERRAWPRTACT
jgi:phage/plasmid primase-like uncharacterized protein